MTKSLKQHRIVVAVTGCIAAYKAAQVVSTLVQDGVEVRVVMTKQATKLVAPLTFQSLSSHPVLYGHSHTENGMDHIELSKWGELLLIAPCTANTMAKLALGIADDIVSTLSLAFEGQQLLVPAMNPGMWKKASVQRNLKQLQQDDFAIIGPNHGQTACGDEGEGRMSEPEEILSAIAQYLK